MNPDGYAVRFDHVTYRFPDGREGLREICLEVGPGEFVVVAGANGSGKSTLLRHLNGLLLPVEGEVTVAGRPVRDNLRWARQVVGMVFQDSDSQIVGETVWDDAAFGPENLGLGPEEIRERVRWALSAVGLADAADRRPHLLSGGEKRRLAVAGVLAMDPQVMVFDEPFNSLDLDGIGQVSELIVSLNRAGRTVWVATHELERVLPHAHRLVLLRDGRLARDERIAGIPRDLEPLGVRQPCPACMRAETARWRR